MVWIVRRIIGSLHIGLLKECLDFLVARHETLRTRIGVGGDMPEQLVDAARSCAFDEIDLSGFPIIRREQELERLCKELIREELNPTVGPLFAARLFRLSSEEYILLLALDHLIADRATNVILHNELWQLYRQAARAETLHLPELPVQFGDYAIWQHQTCAAWRSLNEQYWRGRLSGLARIDLPKDGVPLEGDPVYRSTIFQFGRELTAKLAAVARSERTDLAVVVLTAYAIAMSHWCKRRDLLVWFAAHTRYRAETRNMVGWLGCDFRLPVRLDGDDHVSGLLKRIHQEICSAYAHLDIGWGWDLYPESATEISFNWNPSDALTQCLTIEVSESKRLLVEPYRLTIPYPCPLAAFFHYNNAEVSLKVSHRPDVYSPSSIENFGRDLLGCATRFVQEPLMPIALI